MMPKYKVFGEEHDLMDTTILACEVCTLLEWEGQTYIVPDRDAGKYMAYNPFESPNLYTAAAKLDCDNMEQLMQFWKRYGHVLKRMDKKVLPEPFAYPLAQFIDEIAQVKQSLDWIYALEAGDLETLERYKADIIAGPDIWKNARNANSRILASKSAKEAVRYVLSMRINQQMKNISPYYADYEDYEIITYTTDSLLSVIYYQMAEHRSKQRELKRCLWCKSYFTPMRADKAVYCPPSDRDYAPGVPRLKHSSCNAAYNQQVLRTRRSIRSGKKTVEQWARKLGRPVQEIQGWIDTYNKEE